MTQSQQPGSAPVSAESYQPTLKLLGDIDIVWAQFDPTWYLATYPSVRDLAVDTSDGSLLYFYLQHGRRLGHSPNRFFSETWYTQTYLDVAAEIDQGSSICGFQHYCRVGHRDRSPHWLFDETLYRRNYPSLTDEVLKSAGMANGYDHYLRHGSREDRIGHYLFDPVFYRAQLGPESARETEEKGQFRHYLERIEAGKPEVPTSRYFDPTWYIAKYEEVADSIAQGRWRCALEHYLRTDAPTAFDPLPQFSEAYYLARYAEAAAAVGCGQYRNGYEHFLSDGRFDPLSPSATIDLAYYRSHRTVQNDLEQGRAPDAFTHLLAVGRELGLSAMPASEEELTEAQARQLFVRRSREWLPIFGRSPLSFACANEPTLSVVMAVRENYATTLATLGSLRHAHPGDIELVLVDIASQDDTRQIERFVLGATLLRLDDNIGEIAGRNAGLHLASGNILLFLGNEIEVAPGAVAAALRRLRSDPTIGAVGAKVIRGNGVLREAGNRIVSDGGVEALQAAESPLCPEANYVRTVDFCSSAFLLVPGQLLRELDGFSGEFETLRYVDADLGARIAGAGYRTVYDPSVVVYDHRQDDREQVLEADKNTFLQKHGKDERIYNSVGDTSCKGRLLFIETSVERLAGSGFVRSNDIMRTIASLGWQVTVFPLQRSRFSAASIYADLPDTVEIMFDRSIADLPRFLTERAGCYDVLWVGRTHNLDSIADVLRSAFEGSDRRPSIVLDTEAVASLREAERAKLGVGQEPFDLGLALAREFHNTPLSDSIVAVSRQEADCLRTLGYTNVAILGHTRDTKPTPRTFEERAGMLFVGAIHEEGGPNYDSLCWLLDLVLPVVEEALGWETRLTIAGYVAEKVDISRFRDHPRLTLRGMVADLEPLYDAHRLFIAPTRFAAGIPYKVYEAASYGIPVVTSELLRAQMGWENGRELLAADISSPQDFAHAILRVYRDTALWESLRTNALDRLRAENDLGQYAVSLGDILNKTL